MCGLMSPRAMPVNLKQDVQAGAGPLALAVMAGVLAGFRRQEGLSRRHYYRSIGSSETREGPRRF